MSRPPPISCQGHISFPIPSTFTSHLGPPSMNYYGHLMGTTLLLYRDNPRTSNTTSEPTEAEQGRVQLGGREWVAVRRGKEIPEGVFLVTMEGRRTSGGSTTLEVPHVLSKKTSSHSLTSSTSSQQLSLAADPLSQDKQQQSRKGIGKLLRTKRGKSISHASDFMAPSSQFEPDSTSSSHSIASESFTIATSSSSEADKWGKALSTAFLSALYQSSDDPPPSLPNSSSLPSGLSSRTNLSTYKMGASKRPSTAQPTSSTNSIPPPFNPDRRPSFLDRPPPSPRSYVTTPSPSSFPLPPIPPKSSSRHSPSFSTSSTPLTTSSAEGTPASVPAWIQGVRTASKPLPEVRGSPLAATVETANHEEPKLVRPKRSLSMLGRRASTASSDRERLHTDDGASTESGATATANTNSRNKLLGFLGGGKKTFVGREGKDSPGKKESTSAPPSPLLGSNTSTSSSPILNTSPVMNSIPSFSPSTTPTPTPRRLASPLLYPTSSVAKASSISLADSLLSESQSTAPSSDAPLTPELNELESLNCSKHHPSSRNRHPSSNTSATSASSHLKFPTSITGAFSSRHGRRGSQIYEHKTSVSLVDLRDPISDQDATPQVGSKDDLHQSPSSLVDATSNGGHDGKSARAASTSPAEQSTLRSVFSHRRFASIPEADSTLSSSLSSSTMTFSASKPSIVQVGEHIVPPAELVLRMRQEFESGRDRDTGRVLYPTVGSGGGGLSPAPRRLPTKIKKGLVNSTSSTKLSVNRLSIGSEVTAGQ